MLKLFKLNEEKYVLLVQGKEFEGNEEFVMRLMLQLDIRMEEIVAGLEALDHDDMAVYGIAGFFIFSKKLIKAA